MIATPGRRRFRLLIRALPAVAGILVVSLLLYLNSGHPERWLGDRLAAALEDTLGRGVTFERVVIGYLPPAAAVEGLRTADGTIEVARIEAAISPAAALRGRIAITDVDVYRPVVRWNLDTETMLARLAGRKREDGTIAARVDLDRLRVIEGIIVIGSERRALTVEVADLSLHADNTAGGINAGWKGPWDGSLHFTRGRIVLDELALVGIAGSVAFSMDGEGLRARKVRVRTERVDLEGEGEVITGGPLRSRWVLGLTLDPASPSLTLPALPFSARELVADAEVTLSDHGLVIQGTYRADRPALELDLDGDAGDPPPPLIAERVTGTFTIDGPAVRVEADVESLAGGTVHGTYLGSLPDPSTSDRPRTNELSVIARDLSLEQILALLDIPGDESIVPGSAVAAKGSLRWSWGLDDATGSVGLEFTPAGGAWPLSGSASLSFRGRRLAIDSSSLDLPGSHIGIAGSIDARPEDLVLDLSGTLDSTGTLPLSTFIESRFGLGAGTGQQRLMSPTDLEGALSARFTLRGTAEALNLHSDIEAGRATIALPRLGAPEAERHTVEIESARGTIDYRNDLLEVELGEIRGQDLALSGRMAADLSRGRLLELRMDADPVPASLLAAIAGLDPSIASGSAQAAVELASPGSGGGIEGTVSLTAGSVVIAGMPIGDLAANAAIRPDGIDLHEAGFELYGGSVRGSGRVDLSGQERDGLIDIEASGIDLAVADTAYPGPSLEGLVNAQGRVRIGDSVTIDGTVSGPGVALAGIGLKQVTGSITGPIDALRFEIHEETGRLKAMGGLTTGSGDEGPVLEAELTIERFGLEDLRPLLPPGSLPGLLGTGAGTVTLRVPFGGEGTPEMRAVLSEMDLRAGDYPLHSDGPVTLTLQDRFMTLAPVRLVGEKTDLVLGGSMVVGGSYELTAKIQGNYDLGLIEVILPEIRAAGPGTIDMLVIERGQGLTYSGSVTIDGGTFAHPAMPLALTGITGEARVTEEGRLEISSLRCIIGGGSATGTGWARLEGASVPELHLELAGEGIRAEILKDFKAFFDADMTLDRRGGDFEVAGTVRIQRAIYSRRFGVESSGILARNREYVPRSEAVDLRADRPDFLLDIDIVAADGLWVRNEDASIEASADLKLGGTLESPELSGRVLALEGGSYRFRDVTYKIVGGTLDFTDVDRVDPLINIEATTQVREFEVTLRIGGRFSNPVYEISSNPALPQQEIVWMLITGKPPDDDTYDQEKLKGEGEVASYLASPVAGIVAVPLEKLFGVSSVSIDPYFLNGTADPSARVTVTKRVASNMLITYSSSIGDSGEDVYQVEYNPARRWDLIGTRDQDGSLGADARFRRRWLGWKPEPLNADMAEPAPRFRVGAIHIDANRLLDKKGPLIKLLPFDAGDPLRRGDLLEGREALRLHYVKHGYPAAHVDFIEGEPDQNQHKDISYSIIAGPQYSVRIEGETARRSIRKAVQEAWMEPFLLEDLAGEARNAALAVLEQEGFPEAAVEAEIVLQDPGNRVLLLRVDPGPRIEVNEVRITGNESIPEERIRGQMLTAPGGFTGFFGKDLLKESVLEDDLLAIRALYRSEGFLDVLIRPPDIEVLRDGKRANVTIHIEEGSRSLVGSVAIEGEAEDVSRDAMMLATGVAQGTPVNLEKMKAGADNLRDLLDRNGYPDARVSYRIEGSDPEKQVTFSVNPGERMRVGTVTLTGNTRTQTRIVDREITVEDGEYMSRADILRTQRNLYRLGVFSSVKVETRDVEGKPGTSDVEIEVREGSPLMTAWGLGYNTRDRTRGSFEIGNNNLFGTRRSASLFLLGSAVEQRAQMNVRDPNLLGNKIETLLTGFWERQVSDSFGERRTGAGVQLSRKMTTKVTLFGRYRLEDVSLFDLEIAPEETGEEDIRLGSAGPAVAYDSRNDIIDPRSGGLASLDYQIYTQALGSEAQFGKLFGSASYYKSFGPSTVWASSLRAGIITSRDIPISERFFAGGDTTIRGFDYDEVGPKDEETGNPVGGQGLFIFNQELRFPIYKILGGVVFYDSGNVFADPSDYDLGDLRHVLGLGIRVSTPVGPFRIEYGRKLERESRDESLGELFFSIGQPF